MLTLYEHDCLLCVAVTLHGWLDTTETLLSDSLQRIPRLSLSSEDLSHLSLLNMTLLQLTAASVWSVAHRS